MMFSIKNFFHKCDKICRKLRIWSHFLKKSLMENIIFCTVTTDFTEISEIEDNFFQLTDNDLSLHRNILEGKVVPVDWKTLRTQILCKKSKSEMIFEEVCLIVKNAIKYCQKYNV